MNCAKKFLSVLLCLVTLMGLAVPVYAQGSLIKKVEAEFVFPHAGDKAKLGSLNVSEPEKYSAEVYRLYYFDYQENKYVYVYDGDVYEEGVRYYVRILFKANDGYTLSGSSDENGTKYYVNGEEIKGSVGTNMVELSFVADNFQPPEEPEPAGKPTLFQRIISFFKFIRFQLSLLFGRIFGSRDI